MESEVCSVVVHPQVLDPHRRCRTVKPSFRYPSCCSVSLDADPDRLKHLFRLDETGGGRPVRKDQPVDNEVAVVQFLVEVSAVGEKGSGFARLGDTVVDPFPDEATVQAIVAFEQFAIFAQ